MDSWLMLAAPVVMISVFCLFILLLTGGLIFVLVRMGRRVQAFTPPAEERTPEGFFAKAMPTLLPWDSSAFADLSNRWEGWWLRLAKGYSQGVIKSLGQPGAGWIAFVLERNTFRSGVMTLRTARDTLRLDIQGGGQFDTKAQVQVKFNDELLGQVRLPDGLVMDAAGQPIGQLQRRGVAMRNMHYSAVTLYGRSLGGITDIWIRQPQAQRRPEPAMQNIPTGLSEEDEKWLLALIGVELYYDALWERQFD